MGEMTFKDYGELVDALSKKRFLNTKEAAVFLGMSMQTIYAMAAADDCDFKVDLTGKKMKYLYDREKLEAYVLRKQASNE